MSSFRRRTVRRLLTFAISAVAIVVVVLVVMIGTGVLVLPSKDPARVTISMVQLQIEQGTNPSGVGWFGMSTINYTSAEGYPIQVALGGTWSVAYTFFNLDDRPHNITMVTPSPQEYFSIEGTVPALPYAIGAGEDGAISIIVTVDPSTPVATYAVILVVAAVTIG